MVLVDGAKPWSGIELGSMCTTQAGLQREVTSEGYVPFGSPSPAKQLPIIHVSLTRTPPSPVQNLPQLPQASSTTAHWICFAPITRTGINLPWLLSRNSGSSASRTLCSVRLQPVVYSCARPLLGLVDATGLVLGPLYSPASSESQISRLLVTKLCWTSTASRPMTPSSPRRSMSPSTRSFSTTTMQS